MSDKSQVSHQEPVTVVKQFLDAWGAFDFERVMALFDENAVFGASVGPEPGRTYNGRSEIEPAVKQMLAAGKGSQFAISEMLPLADGAVVTWTQSGTTEGGQSLNVKGIDIFKATNGRIVLKNAYRKVTQS